MPISVTPYSSQYLHSIRRLNARFREAGVPNGYWLPERDHDSSPVVEFQSLPTAVLTKNHFLLVDGQEVRGGFIIQDQQFDVNGQRQWVANIQMPVSEGLVDNRYGYLAVQMLRLILKRSPLSFAVGMGGMDQPFPRLLAASKWRVEPVPFYFRVLRTTSFLRQLRLLHTTALRAFCANLAVVTGAGSIGIPLFHTVQRVRSGGAFFVRRQESEPVLQWGPWADELWESYTARCSLAAVRTAGALALFHQPSKGLVLRRFVHLNIPCGWAAMQITPFQDNLHFGNLRVATILDLVAMEGYEAPILEAAVQLASEHGAELVVSNQSHSVWREVFPQSGFLSGPSNFLCALSPALQAALEPLESNHNRIHITRADGDGRIHL